MRDMNTFNRVLVIPLLLGLVVVLTVGLLQPAASLAALGRGVASVEAFAATHYYGYLLVACGALVLAVVLLFLELRRPQRTTVKLQRVSGSVVELTTESVARGLEYHIGQVPGVVAVRPRVVSTGNAVRVALELETDPALDVAAKSEEIVQLAREIIEGKLGLKLAKVSASIRQAAYPAGDVPVVKAREARLDLPAGSSPPFES
jgi:hypothetical protein